METTDYVDYPTAVALKECGFDEPCIAQWACEPDGKPILLGSTAFVFSNAELKGRDVTAPLLFHAQKWLREVKGLHIAIKWGYSFQWLWFGLHITKFPKGDEFEKGNFGYSTYEQALFAGISASLELIKKGE